MLALPEAPKITPPRMVTSHSPKPGNVDCRSAQRSKGRSPSVLVTPFEPVSDVQSSPLTSSCAAIAGEVEPDNQDLLGTSRSSQRRSPRIKEQNLIPSTSGEGDCLEYPVSRNSVRRLAFIDTPANADAGNATARVANSQEQAVQQPKHKTGLITGMGCL